jgi:hypothetical protein
MYMYKYDEVTAAKQGAAAAHSMASITMHNTFICAMDMHAKLTQSTTPQHCTALLLSTATAYNILV